MVSSTFEDGLTGLQVDPSCLTIDKTLTNSAAFVIPCRLSKATLIALITNLTLY